jgi:hypothetical protein
MDRAPLARISHHPLTATNGGEKCGLVSNFFHFVSGCVPTWAGILRSVTGKYQKWFESIVRYVPVLLHLPVVRAGADFNQYHDYEIQMLLYADFSAIQRGCNSGYCARMPEATQPVTAGLTSTSTVTDIKTGLTWQRCAMG